LKIQKFWFSKKTNKPVSKIMAQGWKWRKTWVWFRGNAFRDAFLMRTMKHFTSHFMWGSMWLRL